MKKIFNPAISLLNKLKISKKFVLMSLFVVIPVFVMGYIIISTHNKDIKFTKNEQYGIEYNIKVRHLIKNIQQHRGMSNTYLSGDFSYKDKILSKQEEIKNNIQEINEIDKLYGNIFNLSSEWNDLINRVDSLLSGVQNMTVQDSFDKHTLLISNLLKFIMKINEQSNLVLDPNLNDTYLINVSMLEIPMQTELTGQARAKSMKYATSKIISSKEKIELSTLIIQMKTSMEEIMQDMNVIYTNNPYIQNSSKEHFDTAVSEVNKFYELVNTQILYSENITVLSNDVWNISTNAIDASFELCDILSEQLKVVMDERVTQLETERNRVAAIALIGMLVVIYLYIAFSLAMIESITKIKRATNSIAEGDLTIRVEADSKDEIGDLIREINITSEKLEDLIRSIKYSAETVSGAANEISKGNEDLSQRTQEQASSLEETSSAIEELTATVKQNSENAKNANKMSSEAVQVVGDGNKVVQSTIQAMEEVNASSKKILEIINVVNEIAFQTNLLALNAAVEAARAGEQGRGFAVVAVEVRNLAQRSAGASKEIQYLINDSVNKIENGNKLVLKTGENLEKITESISRVSNLISQISTASHEQTIGIEEINKAVIQMEEVTQQNAALVEEASSSSQAMSGEAEELFSIVEQFKIRDDNR